jgi:hypothetical protein
VGVAVSRLREALELASPEDYLEHEAQAPARQTDGAPPRVRYDPDASIVIMNEATDKPGELPYTGPTTERTGPETP